MAWPWQSWGGEGARIIAKRLGENLGVSVTVENKAGAGGNIAHQFTATGPADGSVLLLGSVGPLAIAPHMMKLPYDPVKDLTAVSEVVTQPLLLVAHPSVPAKNFRELIDLVRSQTSPLAESAKLKTLRKPKAFRLDSSKRRFAATSSIITIRVSAGISLNIRFLHLHHRAYEFA